MRLTVCQSAKEDVFRDLVRIPEAQRLDRRERPIENGAICKITVRDKSILATVRGCGEDELPPYVFLDRKQRDALGVSPPTAYDFDLRPVWLIGQCRWGWHASDPAYRLAARLGLLSVTLSVVSVVLGGVGFVLSVLALLDP